MIDWTKPVQTRDGRKARVICTDMRGGVGQLTVVVLIEHQDGEYVVTTRANGWFWAGGMACEIVNVPERTELWTNMYENGTARCYLSRSIADRVAGDDRIGVIRITLEDGKPIAVELEAI